MALSFLSRQLRDWQQFEGLVSRSLVSRAKYDEAFHD